MKQQDIAVIVIIIFIAGIASFFVSSKFISPPKKLSAETVSPIEANFPLPDNKVFNSDAINPTVKIKIAPVENPEPFTTGQ